MGVLLNNDTYNSNELDDECIYYNDMLKNMSFKENVSIISLYLIHIITLIQL